MTSSLIASRHISTSTFYKLPFRTQPWTTFLSRPVYHLVSRTARWGCPSARESESSLKLQSSTCIPPARRPRGLNIHISRGPNLPLFRLMPTLEIVSLSCDGMFVMGSEYSTFTLSCFGDIFCLSCHRIFSNIITTAVQLEMRPLYCSKAALNNYVVQ